MGSWCASWECYPLCFELFTFANTHLKEKLETVTEKRTRQAINCILPFIIKKLANIAEILCYRKSFAGRSYTIWCNRLDLQAFHAHHLFCCFPAINEILETRMQRKAIIIKGSIQTRTSECNMENNEPVHWVVIDFIMAESTCEKLVTTSSFQFAVPLVMLTSKYFLLIGVSSDVYKFGFLAFDADLRNMNCFGQ